MKTYFKFRETNNGGWMIGPVWEEFWSENQPMTGSFNLLACRVSGLSWPQWLRYCRQNGATLYGKGSKYVVAIWKEPNQSFLKSLNERANILSKFVDFKKLDL